MLYVDHSHRYDIKNVKYVILITVTDIVKMYSII